jgi:hypothetical protein
MSAPHPKAIINNKKLAKEHDDEELIKIGIDFLEEEALLRACCIDKMNLRPRKCSCLTIFEKVEEDVVNPLTLSVARYMVYFSKKQKFDQQMIVIEWIKYANREPTNLTPFVVPFLSDDAEDGNGNGNEDGDDNNRVFGSATTICASALLTILGYSRSFWDTCQMCAKKGRIPTHGLTGRDSNRRMDDELQVDLHVFFLEMMELAEPRATRFIRERTGQLQTRDTEDDLLQLPPYLSKRGLYRRFCFERGWRVEITAKGKSVQTKRHDGDWNNPGIVFSAICS